VSDLTDLLDLLAAKFATFLGNDDAATTVKAIATHVVQADKLLDAGTAAADAMAADVQAARTVAVAPFAAKVAVFFCPDAGITGHNTDFISWVVTKTTAAGAGSTTVASGTSALTSLGTFTALVRKQITASVVANATTVEAGAAIRVATTKGGAGQITPKGQYIVHFEPV
jgi:hypothetical protein